MIGRPLALALSLAPIGCAEEPRDWMEVAGIAVLTVGGHQLILDTGHGGKDSVAMVTGASGDWRSHCRIKGDEIQAMFMHDGIRSRGGFYEFTVDTRNNASPGKPNVFADVGVRLYSGRCELSYTTIHEQGRFEGEVSVEACTLTRTTGEPVEARIDAFVRAKNCVYDGD